MRNALLDEALIFEAAACEVMVSALMVSQAAIADASELRLHEMWWLQNPVVGPDAKDLSWDGVGDATLTLKPARHVGSTAVRLQHK